MFIFGITGQAQHGKGIVARVAKATFAFMGIRVQGISFADPLKEFLAAFVGRREPFFGTGEQKMEPIREVRWCDLDAYVINEAIRLGWLDGAIDMNSHPNGRQLMQLYGTEVVRRRFCDTAWIRIAINRARAFNGLTVIDDVRFANEARREASGGHVAVLVKVVRPGTSIGSSSAHESEDPQAVPESWIDYTFVNDRSILHLEQKVRGWIGEQGKVGRFRAADALTH